MAEELEKLPNLSQPENRKKRFPMTKLWLWGAWLFYVGYVLLSDFPPGESLLHTQLKTLQTAMDLSLNFWFIMPLLFPKLSPVLNPALEGLFNIVVAWGLLFWGFAIDGRGQRFPIAPFLIGTAFLTNVFYLLWLCVRQPSQEPPAPPLSPLEKVGESRMLPIAVLVVVVAALVWAGVARPEFGNLSDRSMALIELARRDRLTYSFGVDLLVFWLFQAALVKDDMVRRQWQEPLTLWVTRLVPLFGLGFYLLRRPPLGQKPLKAVA